MGGASLCSPNLLFMGVGFMDRLLCLYLALSVSISSSFVNPKLEKTFDSYSAAFHYYVEQLTSCKLSVSDNLRVMDILFDLYKNNKSELSDSDINSFVDYFNVTDRDVLYRLVQSILKSSSVIYNSASVSASNLLDVWSKYMGYSTFQFFQYVFDRISFGETSINYSPELVQSARSAFKDKSNDFIYGSFYYLPNYVSEHSRNISAFTFRGVSKVMPEITKLLSYTCGYLYFSDFYTGWSCYGDHGNGYSYIPFPKPFCIVDDKGETIDLSNSCVYFYNYYDLAGSYLVDSGSSSYSSFYIYDSNWRGKSLPMKYFYIAIDQISGSVSYGHYTATVFPEDSPSYFTSSVLSSSSSSVGYYSSGSMRKSVGFYTDSYWHRYTQYLFGYSNYGPYSQIVGFENVPIFRTLDSFKDYTLGTGNYFVSNTSPVENISYDITKIEKYDFDTYNTNNYQTINNYIMQSDTPVSPIDLDKYIDSLLSEINDLENKIDDVSEGIDDSNNWLKKIFEKEKDIYDEVHDIKRIEKRSLWLDILDKLFGVDNPSFKFNFKGRDYGFDDVVKDTNLTDFDFNNYDDSDQEGSSGTRVDTGRDINTSTGSVVAMVNTVYSSFPWQIRGCILLGLLLAIVSIILGMLKGRH